MPEPSAFKYRAFISYSHADTSWAKWLHRGLEGFRIDKDLVGRETATGAIPKTLRPIFRDRDDFTAGHSLNEQTLAALDASAALIVLCSPTSAKSHYVNEEIRLFKSRYPIRPVVPLIVDGKPGDPELECFPPSLKFRLDANGQVTDETAEVLAADARDEGDGKNLALAKVVAGLLGVSSDDVFRRAERERRREGRVRNGIIAVLAMLAVAASGSAVYAWQQLKTNRAFLSATLKTATEIVDEAVSQADRYGVPRTAILALLTKAEGLFDNMAMLGGPTPELRHQKASMLIEFARNYGRLGDTVKQKARIEEAHRIMAKLVAETPDDQRKLYTLTVTLNEMGNVSLTQGNLAAALQSYRDGFAIRERMIKTAPYNVKLQRSLYVSYVKTGDALMAQGHLPEALKSYRASLTVSSHLAEIDPDPQWPIDLSGSYEKVGDALIEQGDLAEFLKAYQASLTIRDQLANADPRDSERQRDLSLAYDRLGDVLKAQGHLPESLKSYGDSLTIRERLVHSDPDNAQWQSDLSSSYRSLGKVLQTQGHLTEALKSYKDGLGICERLAETDPDNAEWQVDLYNFYGNIGNVLMEQTNPAEALTLFERSLAMALRLAKADPSNAQLQRDVGISYGSVGEALARRGNAARALEALREGRAIITQLKEQSPDNATLPADLAEFDAEIAKLQGANATEPGMAKPEQGAR